MKQAENRINDIERKAGRDEVDNRIAEVAALCEIARQLARLGDLYLTDLILHGALGEDTPTTGRSAARTASQTFLRREYDDARSQSSPGT